MQTYPKTEENTQSEEPDADAPKVLNGETICTDKDNINIITL